jgi:uncharacterized protein (UPF0276 family)
MVLAQQRLSIQSRLSSQALGLALRPAYYGQLFEQWPAIDYLEIISENFMGPAAPPRHKLQALARHYPIVMHGVGLNILGHEPLDEAYLEQLCRLADSIDAPFVSDHLCWTRAQGISHHDLLPTPFTRDLIGYAAERGQLVQKRLGRPFALENLSSYLHFPESELSEWEFYQAIVQEADIGMMLDINNVYVSSVNHGFDPQEYLAAIDYERVFQVHLAGHERQTPQLIIDTHDRPVADEVWQLYRFAFERGGPFPSLLEWDDKIPPLAEALQELQKARSYQRCQI